MHKVDYAGAYISTNFKLLRHLAMLPHVVHKNVFMLWEWALIASYLQLPYKIYTNSYPGKVQGHIRRDRRMN